MQDYVGHLISYEKFCPEEMPPQLSTPPPYKLASTLIWYSQAEYHQLLPQGIPFRNPCSHGLTPPLLQINVAILALRLPFSQLGLGYQSEYDPLQTSISKSLRSKLCLHKC